MDLQNSLMSVSSTSKHDQNSFSIVPQFKIKSQEGLSDITSKIESNNNTKSKVSKDILYELEKHKSLPLNGMTQESKKTFLQVVKKLDSKVQQTIC